jgi:integrase
MTRVHGSVRLVGTRWRGRAIVLIVDSATGKRGRRDVRVTLGNASELRTEAAARREFDRRLEQLGLADKASGSMSLAQFVERRFRPRQIAYSAQTCARYSSELRRHILPHLGHQPVSSIDQPTVQKFAADLAAAQLAPSTVCGIVRLLVRLQNWAHEEGIAPSIVTVRKIAMPRSSAAASPPRAFTQAEVRRLLAGSSGWLLAYLAILALAGLRAGEGLGLAWADLDLDAGMLTVRRQCVRGRVVRLKTRTSQATLPVHPALGAILREYHAACGHPQEGLMFSHHGGRPRSLEGVRVRHWRPLLERLGIRAAGLHALRHGYCSALWRADAPAEAIRRLMRHANLAMTQRYSQGLGIVGLRAAIERLTVR